MELTQEYLKSVLHYDPVTGVFTWKVRTKETAPFQKQIHCWNGRFANVTAGSKTTLGYIGITLLSVHQKAHRLAWLYVYGELPKSDIDHINGNRADNRIANLRAVSRRQNTQNAKIKSNNTSGYNGVSWRRRERKWYAKISSNGKEVFLGCFGDLQDAIAARRAANIQHGYHPNHGRNS